LPWYTFTGMLLNPERFRHKAEECWQRADASWGAESRKHWQFMEIELQYLAESAERELDKRPAIQEPA
jgi:hypothetical protein